ncbi:putative reverse transcriptase domain-containing protein, partial [Tanacetum coccineum]
MHSLREVDGILVFVDPQDLLGSCLLADIGFITLVLLTDSVFLFFLGFLEYTNLTTGLGDSDSRTIGFLEGTSLVVVILVKGHAFPTIVKVRPVGLQIYPGVGAHTEDGIYMGVGVATSDIREDEEEFEVEANTGDMREVAVDPLANGGISDPTGGDAPDLEGTLYDIANFMSEAPLDRITEVRSLGRENLRVRDLLCIERDRVNSLRHHMALSKEEFRQIRRDRDDTQRRLRRIMTNTRSGMTPTAIEEMINRRVTKALETREANRNIRLGNGNNEGGNGNGNGNGNGRGNGSGIHNENDRYARPVVRECTYQDFMKCQPLNLKGTEGVVGLIRWFEKMETIFHISNCPEKYKVKYATCTLLNSALTWWNSHKRTIGADAAFAMSWRELIKLMDEVYYPRTKIQKMESELWNLTMKNNDLAAYTQRFQDLTMLCTKMVPEEEDRVEKFIGGLPDNIQGNVIAAEPTRLQDAVRMANNLMDQKLKGYAMRNAENKRKAMHYEMWEVQKGWTFDQGPSDFLKLKDQNCGNKIGNKSGIGEARGKAYVLGGGDANPDPNVVTGMFLLNNHYASVLFDLGADRSFVSTTFSTLLDIIPDTLDVSYVVKLVDGRISETNIVLRGCMLGLLGYPFNIDLMPVELGSFDAIIDMNWLANHDAVIVCDEKIVRIPCGDEVLIVPGDRSGIGKKS